MDALNFMSDCKLVTVSNSLSFMLCCTSRTSHISLLLCVFSVLHARFRCKTNKQIVLFCYADQIESVVAYVNDNQLTVGALASKLLQWSSQRSNRGAHSQTTGDDSLLRFLLRH